MSRRLLELWGQALLDFARISKSSDVFWDFFQNGYVKPSNEAEFTKYLKGNLGTNGIESFNNLLKDLYDKIGVVPRTKYNSLHDQYIELLGKNQELEKTIRELRQKIEGGEDASPNILEKWIETTETYTDLNRQFLQEFSKFFTKK